jgi:hypothetical protein
LAKPQSTTDTMVVNTTRNTSTTSE